MSTPDWRALSPDGVEVRAAMLDPHTLSSRGTLDRIVRKESSLMWSEDSETVATGTLTCCGGWSHHSLVRITMHVGDWSEALGTYFVMRSSERVVGGVTTQRLTLFSRLLAARDALLGNDVCVGMGAAALDSVEAMLAGEGVAMLRAPGAANFLHDQAKVYEATTTVLGACVAEMDEAGGRLTVDGMGNAVAVRRVPLESRPVSWAYDADSGRDPMLIGGVSGGGTSEESINQAVVRATERGQGEDERVIWAGAELPGSDPRGFGQRGRRIGKGYNERGVLPFELPTVQRMAADRLAEEAKPDERCEIDTRYVPVREGDAVMLRLNGKWGKWGVSQVKIQSLATMQMHIDLRGRCDVT